jgi:hypothetical protein
MLTAMLMAAVLSGGVVDIDIPESMKADVIVIDIPESMKADVIVIDPTSIEPPLDADVSMAHPRASAKQADR